jgi:hypothetical protein
VFSSALAVPDRRFRILENCNAKLDTIADNQGFEYEPYLDHNISGLYYQEIQDLKIMEEEEDICQS